MITNHVEYQKAQKELEALLKAKEPLLAIEKQISILNQAIASKRREIAEYFEKDKNTLDIMGILWENIVLEVPISISTSENTFQEGNGWELVEEKKESIDPRLAPLRKLLDSEKEWKYVKVRPSSVCGSF